MSEPIQPVDETKLEIPKLSLEKQPSSICNYKNIQFFLVIVSYAAFTLYSFLKFQLKWQNTSAYDLAISFVIGLLLRIAYNLKNDLESIRDILNKEQACEFEKIFQLSSRLEDIVNSTILNRSEAVVESQSVDEPPMTNREIEIGNKKFSLQIPKRK